jgi:nucleoside-diphosphate-sugar epimerase
MTMTTLGNRDHDNNWLRRQCAGHHVRALVRYSSTSSVGFLEDARERWSDTLTIEAGAVEDPGCVNRLIEGTDAVLHLAALIGIPYSYIAPHHYVQTNIVGTINVLDAVRARLKACPAAQGVNTVVRHRHIPVDRRHNSKIDRETLGHWATSQPEVNQGFNRSAIPN